MDTNNLPPRGQSVESIKIVVNHLIGLIGTDEILIPNQFPKLIRYLSAHLRPNSKDYTIFNKIRHFVLLEGIVIVQLELVV